MKQKKWITYGLGLLVIGVWGVVLQRIFSAADAGMESAAVVPRTAAQRKAKVPVLQPDTFSLQLDYPDPFVAPQEAAEDASISAPGEAIVTLALPSAPVAPVVDPLDGVVYLGYILNPETRKRVAILNIAGREYMVQEGQNIQTLKLIRVSAEEICMGHGRNIKRIKIKL